METTYYSQSEMDQINRERAAFAKWLSEARQAAPEGHLVGTNQFGIPFVLSRDCTRAAYVDGGEMELSNRAAFSLAQAAGWDPPSWMQESIWDFCGFLSAEDAKIVEAARGKAAYPIYRPDWKIPVDKWVEEILSVVPAPVFPAWMPEPYGEPLLSSVQRERLSRVRI